MACNKSPVLHTLALILLFWTPAGEAEVSLEVLALEVPGQGTVFPANRTDGRYDVPALSTLTVKCQVSGASSELHLATNEFALYERFNGSRATRLTDTEWQLADLQHYDTGSVVCYDSTNSELQKSIYIFVNDEVSPLFVPLSSAHVMIPRGDYVPCLPTYSVARLSMTHPQDTLPKEIDKTRGVLFNRAPLPLPGYVCVYEYNGRRNEQPLSIVFIVNDLPQPSVFASDGKLEYSAGDTLVMNCMVNYLHVQNFNWHYPALVCEGEPAGSDCRGREGRVTQVGPTLINQETPLLGSTLTITDLSPSDAGQYTCSYKRIGETEFRNPKSQEISVAGDPFVNGQVDDVVVEMVVGDSVTLNTSIQSVPKSNVEWKFGAAVLSPGGRFSMVNLAAVQNGTRYNVRLTINAVEVSDAGYYTMTASVTGESLTRRFNLVVLVPPQIIAMHIYKNKSDAATDQSTIFVRPNQTLVASCRISEGIPHPDITWDQKQCVLTEQCDGQSGSWEPISSTQRATGTVNSPHISSMNQGRQILKLLPQRSVWLRCSASNSVGVASLALRMAVSELPEISRGVGFVEGTEEAVGKLIVDDDLVLLCYVSKLQCNSSSKVEIVRSGTAPATYNKDSSRTTWHSAGDSYILGLTLRNVTLAMSNLSYTCQCNGHGGFPGSRVKLTVNTYLAPSWLKKVNPAVNVTIGAEHSLVCQPQGRPLPEVTWLKDSRPLQSSHLVSLSEDGYTLTLLRVGPEDAGDYSCVGKTNRADQAIYSNFTLTVTEEKGGLSAGEIAMVVCIVIVIFIIAVIVTVCIVRRYCRKKYTPHTLLLPSKEMINPDIPLDEQTDALPYDIGWEFPMGGLKLGMLLGQGAFGRVLQAEAMNIEEGVSSTTVAVKTVRDHHDIEQVKALISELKILIHIGQHLNIVNLLGACTKDVSKGHILVIVEFCRHGNLRSYLLKHKANFNPTMDLSDVDNSRGVKLGDVSVDMGDGDYLNPGTSELHSAEKPVSLRDLMSWSYQIARGMEYLASIDYIHRDLAARNVLLADDNIVKICDFGLAKDIYKYQEYQKQTDGPLPIKWMALESLTHKVFNVRTDIWAYGVTVWELFSLAATPYPGWDIDDTFIDKLQEGYRMEIPKHCPDKIYQEVMLNCWHPDPEKRPNFAELGDLMGESVDEAIKERLLTLEDPYLRTRDSRTDITIRPSAVRQRDRRDLESDYLPQKAIQKSNGSKPTQNDYYNTSPSGSQPAASNKSKKLWKKEAGTNDEKLPLHVHVDEEDDGVDMPDVLAPSPSPWERQSQLARRAAKAEDSHSYHSVDSDSARPPSYNYVMKKGGASHRSPGSQPGNAGAQAVHSSRGSSDILNLNRGSQDALHHSPSNRGYEETSC